MDDGGEEDKGRLEVEVCGGVSELAVYAVCCEFYKSKCLWSVE